MQGTIDFGRAVPFAQYAAIRAVNATAIKAGDTSMLHMHHRLSAPPEPDKPAFRWGRLVHAAVLEPDRFNRTVTIFDGTRRGKVWADALLAAEDPDMIVKPNELDELRAIQASVLGNADVAELLADGCAEASINWDDPAAGPSKARLDYVNKRVIADLKTAREIGYHRFISNAASYGYHLQFAWYRRGLRHITGEDREFYVIAVESAAPYDVGVFEVPGGILDEAEDRAVAICKRYRKCEQTGTYPGIYNGVQMFDLPEWKHAEMDEGVDWGTQ